MHDIIIGGL